MATSSSLSFITIILLTISLISLSSEKPLIFSLKNTLSPSPSHHLLKLTAKKSLQKHFSRQISLPLTPGSDYTLSLKFSNQTTTLYMDTGSDLVWLPCKPFECILCEDKEKSKFSPFNVKNSSASPVSCKSPACSAAHSNVPNSDLCAMAKCPLDEIETTSCKSYKCPNFYYAYGDGSLVARLYTDHLAIPMSTPSMLAIKNFTFGCAHHAIGEPMGVAGFGRGLLSLPAQLATSSPGLGNRFSYCLVSHSFKAERVSHPSPLILGRYSSEEKTKHVSPRPYDDFIYTSILENPKYPFFYSVGLKAVSIGKQNIPAPKSLASVDTKGNGGMVVDSGTTFTILPTRFYNSIVKEFDLQVGKGHSRASQVEASTGLSPCYYYDNVAKVPTLVLHFVGNNSSVTLPKRNYFYEFLDGKDKKKVGCVMVVDGGDGSEEGDGGAMATLGNYQQQGFEVVYDLENGQVGFAKRKCSSLWDSLNRS